jgi:hypothetical protein
MEQTMSKDTAAVPTLDWYAEHKKGTIYNPPNRESGYFKVTNTIDGWRPVKSMRFGVYRNGKRTMDIDIADWGVGTRRNDKTGKHETWLSLQLVDRVGQPSSDHDYLVHVNIEFGTPGPVAEE